jgi:uncharacterized protein YndB with AHSA1/START domain
MVATSSAIFSMTTPTERELVLTRLFDAPRALVFEACTSPRHLPHWMPGPPGWTISVCEVDLRTGGSWRLRWRNSGNVEMEMHGIYRDISSPELLVSTDSWGRGWPETFNTVIFSEQDGKTTFTANVLFPSKKARDTVLSTGIERDISLNYDRLAHYLHQKYAPNRDS